jgi:uncharacterized membrane protein YsdA (DUF1294 family)
LKNFDFIAAIWFAVWNTVALLAFGCDKWRAVRCAPRISEQTLVGLGALGGWPAGWLGMKLFRHKTSRWTFRLKYALAFLPFAGEIWAWLSWR